MATITLQLLSNSLHSFLSTTPGLFILQNPDTAETRCHCIEVCYSHGSGMLNFAKLPRSFYSPFNLLFKCLGIIRRIKRKLGAIYDIFVSPNMLNSQASGATTRA